LQANNVDEVRAAINTNLKINLNKVAIFSFVQNPIFVKQLPVTLAVDYRRNPKAFGLVIEATIDLVSRDCHRELLLAIYVLMSALSLKFEFFHADWCCHEMDYPD
jgi:hypothetical protein